MKEDDEEVEARADGYTQHGQEREPAVEHVLQAESERHVAEEYNDVANNWHDQNVNGDDNKLALGLGNARVRFKVRRSVNDAEIVQLAHGYHTERELSDNG